MVDRLDKFEAGKIPPQAPDLEEAVLGAILVDKEAIDDAYTILDSPEYFYKHNHQLVYEAILTLYKNDRAIDILTVTDQLRSVNKLEAVGGAAGVVKLTARVGSALHVREHAAIVKQYAIKRELLRVGQNMIKQSLDDTIDVDDLLGDSGNQVERAAELLHGGSIVKSMSYYVNKSMEELEERERAAREGKITGIPTPVAKLNRATEGWHEGELTVIAARPSMGKTAFMLSSVTKAAEAGFPVNVYSLEMAGERLADRMICGLSGVNPEDYRAGKITADDWQAVEIASDKLGKLPVYIDDNPNPTMEYIKSRSRINKRKGRCSMIMIDYVQLINVSHVPGRNREQEVANISRKAKLIAMELGVPVVLLAQLNRSCELRPDKRPMLADLRESGAIEQDADNVLLLFRAERYGLTEVDGESVKGKGEIIVAKQRNGAIGTVFFGYNESLTRIYDFSGDLEPEREKPEDIAVRSINPTNHISDEEYPNDAF